MKQRWSSFRGFQMAFFLARVSGSSFQQPPASLGGGGAGMSASCCEGAVSRYAAVAHHGPVGLGEAGALERHLELRPNGRHHGSGAGRRRRGPHDPRRQPEEVVRELHPVLVLVLVVYGRARQQDLEADLGEEGQPNWSWSRSTSSRMASMVKTCCPGRGRSRSSRVQAAPHRRSSVTAASALGARGSSKGTARTALSPRRPQMRSDSSEIMARIGLS